MQRKLSPLKLDFASSKLDYEFKNCIYLVNNESDSRVNLRFYLRFVMITFQLLKIARILFKIG